MEKKPVVKLRVYRGTEVNYDANGKIKNDNHLVSLIYNTRGWVLFMENLRRNGYCKVDVESVFKQVEGGYEQISVDKYAEEVKTAFEPVKISKNSEIDELKKQIDEIRKGNETKDVEINTLSHWRKEYKKVFGKKPFNGWDVDTLKIKCEEEK